LILEKLSRKLILGMQAYHNSTSNLKHIPNGVNILQTAGS
jgi:hypothetical protein